MVGNWYINSGELICMVGLYFLFRFLNSGGW
nr:MAG TPA: hypothetical protein [Caudoviricetes sp.]